MAREFKPLFVLWLVVACLGATTSTAQDVSVTTANVESTSQEVSGTSPNVESTSEPAASATTAQDASVPTANVEPTGTTEENPIPVTTPAAPVDPSTAPAPTTAPDPPTTELPHPCDANICKDGSTCLPHSDRLYICLCLPGDVYVSRLEICIRAKVFPGQLNLPDKNLPYHQNMNDKTSQEFLNASKLISFALFDVFGENGFSGAAVLELSPKPSPVMSRSEDGVSATVEINFLAGTDITTAEVQEALKNASACTDGCLLADASFDVTTLCDKKTCEEDTATCQSGDGSYNCTCLPHFIETDFSSRMCSACPHGQKAEDSKKCVDCSFGYSGFGCRDSWLLKLVVVSSVLGVLLLIALILLPILASKSSKKSSKKDKNADTGKPYVSNPPAKQPLVNGNLAQSQAAPSNGPANGLSAFANAGVPRIPRATTANSWDSRSNLEMIPSNSRQNLIPVGRNSRFYNDQDDMNPNAQVRPQSNLYTQVRPSLNNPYAQSPAQTRPYAQSQGHSNPYYSHDNGRRLN